MYFFLPHFNKPSSFEPVLKTIGSCKEHFRILSFTWDVAFLENLLEFDCSFLVTGDMRTDPAMHGTENDPLPILFPPSIFRSLVPFHCLDGRGFCEEAANDQRTPSR